MNTLFIPVFLFSVIASTVFAQSTFTINTPANLVQCEPALLSWTGGSPEYFLVHVPVMPAGQPSATPLVSFTPMNGTSFTWNVNVSQGVGVFFNLRDSTGALAQSGTDTILTSSDNSCINASAVVPIASVSSSVVGTSTSGSGSTAAAGSSATGTTGGGITKGSSSSSTSTGATTSPSHAAAASHYAPIGTLAMTGAALAIALVL